jgi:dipeptidase D
MARQLETMLATSGTRRRMLGGLLGGASILTLHHLPLASASQATPASAERVPLREALDQLDPRAIWEHFYQITQIPRQSRHEEQISAFLAAYGADRSLETLVDDAANVLIRKSATPGMEARQGVILQSHMDMVPVAAPGSDHDWTTDPISAYVENGWVRADGTTLGADEGIGIAIILAVLDATDIAHGPLEALFTVNEEDGFTGATAFQPGLLQGTMLINVDSEEEGGFTIGSAGGVNIDATDTFAGEPPPVDMIGVRLEVMGLQGGHSGIDIGRGRGNAIVLLTNLLLEAETSCDIRLASMTGGDRYNAIPRNATAVVALPIDQLDRVTQVVKRFGEAAAAEYARAEPELECAAVETDLPTLVLAPSDQRRFLDALSECPNGVVRMSESIPDLVQTSTNLGLLAVQDGSFSAGFLVRSSVDAERDDVRATIEQLFDEAGFDVTTHDAYSGWQPDPDAPLLVLMLETYRDLFGREAEIMAVHAGLETSMFGVTYPNLAMISVGPTMQNVHSPAEQLEIASVGKVYDLLAAFLDRVPSVAD